MTWRVIVMAGLIKIGGERSAIQAKRLIRPGRIQYDRAWAKMRPCVGEIARITGREEGQGEEGNVAPRRIGTLTFSPQGGLLMGPTMAGRRRGGQ